ncbi:unnamed protein product [Polarella glacialis]|uniref:Uncharacterized protein n=1 Tax=Polarella glacialis TaxID=89957 RepID=A0A813DW96_POLGL|nr:unnamed protein product [Polarella glacialis]
MSAFKQPQTAVVTGTCRTQWARTAVEARLSSHFREATVAVSVAESWDVASLAPLAWDVAVSILGSRPLIMATLRPATSDTRAAARRNLKSQPGPPGLGKSASSYAMARQ